jgi:hypothetical protein
LLLLINPGPQARDLAAVDGIANTVRSFALQRGLLVGRDALVG